MIDGSGSERYKADIGVTNGKIAEIGELTGEKGETVIDAKGLFISPGFVDNHAHSDWTVLVHPTGDSKVMQGVTTELSGLCGYAAAPIDRDEWWKLLYVRMTVGWSMHYSAAAYNSWPLPYGRQLEVDWSTMGEY
ncbi:MAG: amidohydrolase family protein, partial [Candidatus Bathyarchaeota archaeon]|nr:amidohydrolase family protein [Candidatus Bathyarchaeota archaeon]